jgi:hypothetical protein
MALSSVTGVFAGRVGEFDTSSVHGSASFGTPGGSRPEPPLPAPNLNAAVFVKVKDWSRF